MSAYSRFRHPFDVARHPTLEPEVKRAILASWASDANAVESHPALRHPAGVKQSVPVDEVLAALRSLDGAASSSDRRGYNTLLTTGARALGRSRLKTITRFVLAASSRHPSGLAK